MKYETVDEGATSDTTEVEESAAIKQRIKPVVAAPKAVVQKPKHEVEAGI